MVPEGVRSEAVIGEPTLSSVTGAVRGGQRLIQGDGSLLSYYESAMLERAFSMVGAFWHGLPFHYGEMTYEKPDLSGWTLLAPLPETFCPSVRRTDSGVKVVYYAQKEFYGMALLQVTVDFVPGVYFPDTTIVEIATKPGFIVV